MQTLSEGITQTLLDETLNIVRRVLLLVSNTLVILDRFYREILYSFLVMHSYDEQKYKYFKIQRIQEINKALIRYEALFLATETYYTEIVKSHVDLRRRGPCFLSENESFAKLTIQ